MPSSGTSSTDSHVVVISLNYVYKRKQEALTCHSCIHFMLAYSAEL